jgi:hypothetical protein
MLCEKILALLIQKKLILKKKKWIFFDNSIKIKSMVKKYFLTIYAVIVTVAFLLVVSGNVMFGEWGGPPSGPPAENVFAPINIGSETQYKSGAFGVGGLFRTYSNAIFHNAEGAVSVGIGTSSPNASALLDLTSTTQGLLVPRMTTAQRDAISSPADGLIFYNTTDNRFQGRANGAWVNL